MGKPMVVTVVEHRAATT
jgi:hypothetical protein